MQLGRQQRWSEDSQHCDRIDYVEHHQKSKVSEVKMKPKQCRVQSLLDGFYEIS